MVLRGALPLVVLPVAAFSLLNRKKLKLLRRSPSRLLMIYGGIATFSSIFSPEPLWSLYWSIAFLATILTAWTFIDRANPLDSARQLLLITWIGAFIVAAIIGYEARNSVFGEASTAYNLVNSDLSGLSRASGVGRWSAVAGLVCLIRAYHTRRAVLIAFFLGAAAAAFYIVYRMQSRGSAISAVAALLFTLLISSKMRRYALPFAAAAIVIILVLDSPATVSNNIATYLARGENREEFLSMTGRTRAYKHGIAAFQDAPLLGRGQWADRLVIHEHVHNSFLQALLNAGIIGVIPYCASWGVGWLLFFNIYNKNARLSSEDRVCVLECGTVMMFFTVRATPETTTASFAIDLLIMVAVYVYLEALSISMARKPLTLLRLVATRVPGKEELASMHSIA